MKEKRDTLGALHLLGILLLSASGCALSLYFLRLREFAPSDAIYLFAVILLSLLGARLLSPFIRAEQVYTLHLILLCEFFLRSTLYGRFDFFEYTVLEADEERLSHFLQSKVNLVPFDTVRDFFTLSLTSSAFIINVLGNALILAPIPVFFYLAFKDKKQAPLLGLLLAALLSLFAESLQLFFMCGSPDVDDLILNILGGVLGTLIALSLRRIKK